MANFEWDIQNNSTGTLVVYKLMSKMDIRTRAGARIAAARDADLMRAVCSPHICVIDVAGIKLSPILYVYTKCMLKQNPPRALRTYVVNTPKWATKVYAAVRKLLSPADIATTTLHTEPWATVAQLL